jgi:hypothetical protein
MNAPPLSYSPEDIEAILSRLENDWYFYVDGSLLLIEDDKWREYGVGDPLVHLLKTVFLSLFLYSFSIRKQPR